MNRRSQHKSKTLCFRFYLGKAAAAKPVGVTPGTPEECRTRTLFDEPARCSGAPARNVRGKRVKVRDFLVRGQSVVPAPACPFVSPTCRDARALLRVQAGHGHAARRTSASSAGLDVQLSVVVAVISYPGPAAHWLDPRGRGPTGGRV